MTVFEQRYTRYVCMRCVCVCVCFCVFVCVFFYSRRLLLHPALHRASRNKRSLGSMRRALTVCFMKCLAHVHIALPAYHVSLYGLETSSWSSNDSSSTPSASKSAFLFLFFLLFPLSYFTFCLSCFVTALLARLAGDRAVGTANTGDIFLLPR